MSKRLYLAAVLLCAALGAQDTKPPEEAPRVLRPHAYVRRVSAAATLSVLGLTLVPTGNSSAVTLVPVADSLYSTIDASQRIGYGFSAQLAVTSRFAVSGGAFFRRVGYIMSEDTIQGTDNPNTSKDDRTHIVRNQDTRAKLLDIPVVVRFYGKDRMSPGPRWFLEGGAARRTVSRIRTSVNTNIDSGANQCCDLTPAVAARRNVIGLVVGFGAQLIDPVGVRVIPEVRYTRWRGETFSVFSTATRHDQVEAMISLSF